MLYAPTGIAGLLSRAWPAPRASLAVPAHRASVLRPSVEQQASAPPTSQPARRQDLCLQVENVAKHFGGLAAVADISFEVKSGQIVALIGPNGAGKSTLFNLVSGIEIPTHGRVLLEGKDLANLAIHERASIDRPLLSGSAPRSRPDRLG